MSSSFVYDFETLKEAVLFNTAEVLPSQHTEQGQIESNQLDIELKKLIELANQSNQPIKHYIGFEISGRIHVGTGIASALKIKKLQQAGVRCNLFLADYHTFLNNKLDGNLETIAQVATQYFAPVMLQCMKAVGCLVDFDKQSVDTNTQSLYPVQIIFAKDQYTQLFNTKSYFDFDIQVSKHLTLSRILKSISVMGKEAGKEVEFSTLRYPAMQVADAFFMQTHLVHAGMDQRKCHVLMREVASKLDDNYCLKLGQGNKLKPIAIHHTLLLGLEKPEVGKDKKVVKYIKDGQLDYQATITSTVGLEDQKLVGHTQVPTKPLYPIPDGVIKKTQDEATLRFVEMSKMSKSKPNSAIFVDDSPEDIQRKIKLAYCPAPRPDVQSLVEIEMEQTYNPILDWLKNMIFPAGKILQVSRSADFGGDISYYDFETLKTDYYVGKLHPVDLKNAVAKILIDWFEPIRNYVQQNPDGYELLKKLGK